MLELVEPLVLVCELYTTTIDFAGDSTVQITGVAVIDSVTTIASTTTGKGTLTLGGSSTVTGNIGATGKALKLVNVGANATTSTFGGAIHSDTIAFTNMVQQHLQVLYSSYKS